MDTDLRGFYSWEKQNTPAFFGGLLTWQRKQACAGVSEQAKWLITMVTP